MEWRMVPKWLLAMHTYSPASSSDTLTIFRVLLKFSNLTFCPGSSPPFLNHLMMGVGLEEKATGGKTRPQHSGSWATIHFSNKYKSYHYAVRVWLTGQQRYTPAAAAHLAAPFWSSRFLMVRGRSAWTLLLYGLQMWHKDGLMRTNKTFICLCSMTHFLHYTACVFESTRTVIVHPGRLCAVTEVTCKQVQHSLAYFELNKIIWLRKKLFV